MKYQMHKEMKLQSSYKYKLSYLHIFIIIIRVQDSRVYSGLDRHIFFLLYK